MTPRWRRRAARRPRATVVIPTWSWPQALALSLRSALAQTEHRIEVIVVSDGPDPLAQQVVADARDNRVRFMALPERTGSQAVPNAAGIAAARSDRIAYLGHDDLWHPEHIACMVSTADETGADIVHSGILLLGSEGSGVRLLTGIDPSPRWWVPPSGTMHHRHAIDAAGGWRGKPPHGVPVDLDLWLRMDETGATRALTGRVTSVKFPASWKADAYGVGDVAQQQAALQALHGDATWLERQVICAAADLVRRQPSGHGVAMPDGWSAEHASVVLRQRVYKGAVQAADSPDEAHWIPTTEHLAPDWHGPEIAEDGTPFAWTGPGTRASAVLDVTRGRALHIEVRILRALAPDVLDGLRVQIDGQAAEVHRTQDPTAGVRLTARAPAAPERSRVHLAFDVPRTVTPRDVLGSDDTRALGVAVAWITARAVDPFAPPG